MRVRILLIVLLSTTACSSSETGSGGDIGTGGGGGTGGPAADIDTDALLELTEEISAVIADTIPSPATTPPSERDLLGELDALGAKLVELDGIDAFYVDGTALTGTARTSEGLSIAFINNRPSPEEANAPSPATDGSLGELLPKSTVIPGSPRFVAAAFDGGTRLANDVAAMLTDAGYQRVSSAASLNAMRGYKDLAVLHLDTHAAAFLRFVPNESGSLRTEYSFGLQTSTQVGAEALFENLGPELKAQELIIAYAFDDDYRVAKIAITERFIEKSWSFDRGVVMLHSCLTGAEAFDPWGEIRCFGNCSADNPERLEPQALRQAMFNAGAELVVSFDSYTNTGLARPSIEHFFDRLLGANEYSPEAPAQRPFDSGQVELDMERRGLLQFEMPERTDGAPSTVAVKFFQKDDADMLLAPSIESMEIIDSSDEALGELTLTGLFGPNPGVVELDGVPSVLERWTDTEIVARVPYESPGAGQVTVKFPDDVESNEVPLTEWRGTVTYRLRDTTSSLVSQADIDVRFRADVHDSRTMIAQQPEARIVRTYLSPATMGMVTGSGVSIAGPERIEHFGGGPIEVTPKFLVDLMISGGAGGFLETKQLGSPENNVGGVVELDPEVGTATLCLSITASHSVRYTSDGISQTFPTFLPLLAGIGLEDSTRGTLSCFELSLDTQSYRIQGGRRTASDGGAGLELEWTDFIPVAPPEDDTKS